MYDHNIDNQVRVFLYLGASLLSRNAMDRFSDGRYPPTKTDLADGRGSPAEKCKENFQLTLLWPPILVVAHWKDVCLVSCIRKCCLVMRAENQRKSDIERQRL